MENLPERLRASGAIEIRKRLGGIPGGRILDVATGSGDFINTLMKMLGTYDFFVGIDTSRKNLESAKKRLARALFSMPMSVFTIAQLDHIQLCLRSTSE